MTALLARLFGRRHVRELQVSITLDRDTEGLHLVRVWTTIDGHREQVLDPERLCVYGWRTTGERDGTVYHVPDHVRQLLLAVRSLNPVVEADGTMVFRVLPSVLAYLRHQTPVAETPASKRVAILQEPLKPTARIDFAQGIGATVETGYAIRGSGLVAPEDLEPSGEPGYVRLGDAFMRIEEPRSERAKVLLRTPTHKVAYGDIPDFFLRDMVVIRSEFQAVLTDEAKLVTVATERPVAVVRIGLGGPGWIEYQVVYRSNGVEVPHGQLKKHAGGYFAPDGHHFVRADTAQIAEVDRRLKEHGAEATETGYRVPVAEFASVEAFAEQTGGQREVDDAYRRFLADIEGFEPNPAFRLGAAAETRLESLGVHLRPYQRAGIHWLDWLRRSHLHGVLADDMGLGKTLQAVCAVRRAYEATGSREHSLVIAPKSVLVHWQREIQRCYPEIDVVLYRGPDRDCGVLGRARPVIVVVTYATLARHVDAFARVPFLYAIVDEATHIKNPDSQRTRAAKALNAAHRMALSGTPIENRPAELWSIVDFTMRGHLGRRGPFERNWERPIIEGDAKAIERLAKRIRPFMLRRLKKDVAKDLPAKIDMDEWCELSDEQRLLYSQIQGRAEAVVSALASGQRVDYAGSVLPLLGWLKQVCDHPALINRREDPLMGRSPKFDLVAEKIDGIIAGGEQVVVFSHFLGMLALLARRVRERRIAYVLIQGDTQNRQLLIDHFNRGQAKVALCSLQSSGFGITLTGANHVIHADRWWNPAVEDQATDRVHRIGQDRTVYVHRVMVQDTLEERIDRLLTAKRGMAERVMSATHGPFGGWTREELLEILKPVTQ